MTTLAHNNVEHHHGAGDHVHVDYPDRPIEFQTEDGSLKSWASGCFSRRT